MCSARRWRRRARWHKVLPRERDPLFVSVNVSSRQLFRQDMVQEIRLILAREAVPKGTLKLEITESLVMENPERAVEILTWLKTFGASLALDDFGTGYSLAQLSAPLPLRHHQGRPLAGARQRAQRLDAADPPLDHRARRTSSARRWWPRAWRPRRTRAYLRSIGCEYGQGFYYGEPMAAKDVASLLAASPATASDSERERARAPASRKGHGSDSAVARPAAASAPPRA